MKLDSAVDKQGQCATNQDISNRYLQVCTDAEYDALVEIAAAYLDKLAIREQAQLYMSLDNQIHSASEKMELPQKQIFHNFQSGNKPVLIKNEER